MNIAGSTSVIVLGNEELLVSCYRYACSIVFSFHKLHLALCTHMHYYRIHDNSIIFIMMVAGLKLSCIMNKLIIIRLVVSKHDWLIILCQLTTLDGDIFMVSTVVPL